MDDRDAADEPSRPDSGSGEDFGSWFDREFEFYAPDGATGGADATDADRAAGDGDVVPAELPGTSVRAPAGAAGFAGGSTHTAVDRVGQPDQEQIDLAGALRDRLPPPLLAAAREPYGARALVYALLIDRGPEVRARQCDALERIADPDTFALMARLLPLVEALDTRVRLPLIDLALPALRQLSMRQYRRFEHVIDALVGADLRIDLFEWTLQRILRRHLAIHFEGRPRDRRRVASTRRLGPACGVVMAALARADSDAPEQIDRAFAAALRALDLPARPMPDPAHSGLDGLDRALDELDALAPSRKRQLLGACAELIASDGRVAEAEAELFRAISDSLGCPVPPLLPGQSLA